MNGKTKFLVGAAVITALFVVVQPLSAQDKGGVGYFTSGVGWFFEAGESSIVYSAGGGGHSITNRWILGGEGHSAFGPENAGGYGFLNLGYLLWRTDFILVYPLLGLGGGAMTSTIGSSVSKCALVNPTVAADFLIPFRSGSGLLLGLHGGYTFTVYSNTFNWSAPYIRIVVGGYGFNE